MTTSLRQRFLRTRLGRTSRRLWVESNHDPRNTVLLAGTGRSGTTWVGDFLAGALNARTLFEPFLLDGDGRLILTEGEYRAAEEGGTLRRNHQLYLSPAGAGGENHGRLRRILTGRVRYSWVDTQRRWGIHGRRVIKGIRANLLLGYVAGHWPQVRIILLVRDPYRVIESQLRQRREGWDFDWTPDAVLGQEALIREHLRPFVPLLTRAEGPAERLAHKWCIENLVPLRQLPGRPRFFVASYDRLASDRESWNRILGFVGVDNLDRESFDWLLNKRSRTAGMPAKSARGTPLLGDRDRARVAGVLEAYGFPSAPDGWDLAVRADGTGVDFFEPGSGNPDGISAGHG